MVSGWFDAFRDQGAPTWYGDNRTPVVADITTLKIVVTFCIFLVAFLVIFPGIRRAKWTSFLSITLTLLVGAIILVCMYYPGWHVAVVRVRMPYKAFSTDKLDAVIGVGIGLEFVNITLRVKSMQRDFADALQKGLPYPITSIIEYLSVDKAGFIWGRLYRLAGYYTCILLWLALSCWLLQVLMLCLVPSYYSRTLIAVGGLIWLADLVYGLACPQTLVIPFPGVRGDHTLLRFRFGWCFWLTLSTGAICIAVGSVIRVLETRSWCKFTTFLQLDYDEAGPPVYHLNDRSAGPPQVVVANYNIEKDVRPKESMVSDVVELSPDVASRSASQLSHNASIQSHVVGTSRPQSMDVFCLDDGENRLKLKAKLMSTLRLNSVS